MINEKQLKLKKSNLKVKELEFQISKFNEEREKYVSNEISHSLLKSQLKTNENITNHFMKELKNFENKMKSLERVKITNENLMEIKKKNEKQILNLKQKLNFFMEENTKLEQNGQELKFINEKLKQENEKFEIKFTNLFQKIEILKMDDDKKSEDYNNLKNNYELLQLKEEENELKLELFEEKIKVEMNHPFKIEIQNKNQIESKQNLEKEIKNLKNKIEEKEITINKNKKEIFELKTIIENLQNEKKDDVSVQNLKQQNLRLEDELFERKVEIEILTNDLEDVENILSLTKQNYVNEIETTNEANQTVMDALKKMEKHVSEVKQKCENKWKFEKENLLQIIENLKAEKISFVT